MKIGTTLYNTSSTYTSYWAEIAQKCDWIITTITNVGTVRNQCPNAKLLYYTPLGLSVNTGTASSNPSLTSAIATPSLDLTNAMIFDDATTPANRAVDSATYKFIMNLGSSAYLTNKLLELDTVFQTYTQFDGILLDYCLYEPKGAEIWNIDSTARTYYRQLCHSFLWQICYHYKDTTKYIIPNCNPIYHVYTSGETLVINTSDEAVQTTPPGDNSFAETASGEMQEWRVGSDSMDWSKLLTYLTNHTTYCTNKYFFLYCTTATDISAQNNCDLFRVMGNKSEYLVLLTDMFDSSALEEVLAG